MIVRVISGYRPVEYNICMIVRVISGYRSVEHNICMMAHNEPGKAFEGSGRGLIEGTIPTSTWYLGNHDEPHFQNSRCRSQDSNRSKRNVGANFLG
jgi:hypothetical protein